MSTTLLTPAAPGFSFPHLYNWSPSTQLVNFRSAKGAVLAGTAGARCPIICIGDSTTAGVGTDNSAGANGTSRYALAWPARLAAALIAKNFPVTQGNYSGNGSLTDARIVFAGNASFSSANGFGGGLSFVGATTDTVTFTPGSVAFDSVDISYVDVSNSSGHGFTVKAGSQAAQTIAVTTNAQATHRAATLSFTRGVQTVTIAGLASSNNLISTVACWDSTTPQFEIYNGGYSGSTTGAWMSPASTYGLLSGALVLPAKLALVNLGINDANASGLTPAAFATNLTSIVTQVKSIGCDVVLMSPTAINTSADTVLASYSTAFNAVALAQNVSIISWRDRYGSWSNNNAQGNQYDSLHPNNNTYADMGYFLAELLAAA